MYKVGIDARLFSRTGVGVYLRNLLYYLEQDVDNEILFYIYILDEDDEKIKFKNNGFIKKVVNHGWHSISEQIGFAKKLYQDNLDLMHFT
ncbi:hypothetical protein HY357_04890, partial [Candidatus Roizmanbacteria bacterium]|nr:hypothetical protein [Candidatus Roizmanbacteria bacterium]